MSNEDQMHEIEMTLEHAQGIAKFGQAIASLEKNRAFQAVVLDGYFRDEAVRLTGLLAEQGVPRNDVVESLAAISHFRKFLMNRRSMGRTAEKEIADLEQAREEITAEMADEVGGDA
jgi:hypothetical protein